jgi:hypothetical protein
MFPNLNFSPERENELLLLRGVTSALTIAETIPGSNLYGLFYYLTLSPPPLLLFSLLD